jgi:hypothetical protein
MYGQYVRCTVGFGVYTVCTYGSGVYVIDPERTNRARTNTACVYLGVLHKPSLVSPFIDQPLFFEGRSCVVEARGAFDAYVQFLGAFIPLMGVRGRSLRHREGL